MREISLGGEVNGLGLVALVDDDDYERVSVTRWHSVVTDVNKNGAQRIYVRRADGQYLHRFLLDPSIGDEVDHIDGDGLNNQRHNLRFTTRAQNGQNLTRVRICSSRFRGVCWHKKRQMWVAYAYVGGRRDGKHHHLGFFEIEEDAAVIASAFRRQHMPFSEADQEAPDLVIERAIPLEWYEMAYSMKSAGATGREIAEATGCTKSAVYQRLVAGPAKIRVPYKKRLVV